MALSSIMSKNVDRMIALRAREQPMEGFHFLPEFLWENNPQKVIFSLERDYSEEDLDIRLKENIGRSVDYKGYFSYCPYFEQMGGVLIKKVSYIIINDLIASSKGIIIDLNDLLINRIKSYACEDTTMNLSKIVLLIDQDDFSTRRASCK